MVVKQEQKDILRKYIENIDEIMNKEDVDELLDKIDDVIIYNLDENNEPDEIGFELQRVYDQIHYQNKIRGAGFRI